MEDSGDIAAITLTSAMVLGLLDELSGIDNPLIARFCNILAEHPASRTSRTRSLGPSTASTGQLTGPVPSSSDMHVESVPAPAASDATSIVSDPGPVQQPSPETKDNQGSDDEVDDSNVTCCRNGVKRTNLGSSSKRRKVQFGERSAAAIAENAEVGRRGVRRGQKTVGDPDSMDIGEGKSRGRGEVG